MKICIITNYPPTTQALSEYAYNLVSEFKKIKKISKIIVLANLDENLKKFEKIDNKIEIIRCWKNNSTLSLIHILKYIKIIDPNIVYFNLSMTMWGNTKIINFFGALLPFLSRLMNYKVVSTLHNILEITDLSKIKYVSNDKISRVGAYVATWFILKSNIVTVMNKKMKEILESKYNAKNVVHIPHGTFNIRTKKPTFGGNKLLIFGYISPQKDYEMIIEAINELNQERHKLELIIAGTSHPKYPNYLEKLKKKYMFNFVKYTGYIPENKLDEIFQSSTAVILPYKVCTGVSSVINLACSYGRPIIASDIETFHTTIEEEGQEILFYKDKESLKKIIIELISNIELQKKLGNKNLQICRKFNIRTTVKLLASIFDNIKLNK